MKNTPMDEDRTRYGTFMLFGDAKTGIVHLTDKLPELIGIGTDAWDDFRRGIGIGGPHAEITGRGRLHITTPEAEFTYQHEATKRDQHGWYFVCRLVEVHRHGEFVPPTPD